MFSVSDIFVGGEAIQECTVKFEVFCIQCHFLSTLHKCNV
jgi:hypothetical protein